MIRIIVLIVAGIISAPLLEMLAMVWLQITPVSVDLTGNYLLMVVLPVTLTFHFVAALLLWKVIEPIARNGSIVYVIAHSVTQGTLLTVLGNPLADVLAISAIVAVSGSLVMSAFSRYLWCPHCANPLT